MIYPTTLPIPEKGIEINVPFAIRVFEYGRKLIPQPLVSAKVSFFLSQNDLENWNNFYYNELKNGTEEFEVDWEDFTKVKFIGQPQITTVGNLYYKLNIGIISTIDLNKNIVNSYKNILCDLFECTESGVKNE